MAKQNDGRYKSKVVVGHRGDGTPIVKWISGKTKKELERNRQRVLAEYRDGVSADARNVLAMEWIYEYFDTIISAHQKPSTAHDIRREIDRYILPYLKDKQLRAVTFLDIERIVAGLEGKCRSLIVNVTGVLRRSFSAACAQGIIDRDPTAAVKTRLPPRKRNRAFTPDEILKLKQNFSERATEPLMIGLLFYTGMRRGEMLGLQWRDVDFKAGVIHVRRDFDYKTGDVDRLKTANARRDIPIVPELREILMEYRGVGEAFVVHAPSDPAHALPQKTFQRRWAAVKALTAPDVTPRTFRDNYATILYDGGVDLLTASKAMGHADPATMMKFYTDIERSRKVERGADAVRDAFAKKSWQ